MDQILKLITLYVSLEGQVKDIYNVLANKSIVLNKLGDILAVSNVIVIHNILNKAPNNLINNKIDVSNLEAIIDTATKYKNDLTNIKAFYDCAFVKGQQDKVLFNEEKPLVEIKNNGIIL
jgi:hypothetical protein